MDGNLKEPRPAGMGGQLLLLVQKNWRVKLREGKSKLIAEILVPTMSTVLILILLRYALPLEGLEEISDKSEDAKGNSSRLSSDSPSSSPFTIHVVPDNEFSRNFTGIMETKFQELYPNLNPVKFEYYKNEEALEKAYKTAPFRLALILPPEPTDRFQYTIRTRPSEDAHVSLTLCTLSFGSSEPCYQKIKQYLGIHHLPHVIDDSVLTHLERFSNNAKSRMDERAPRRSRGKPVYNCAGRVHTGDYSKNLLPAASFLYLVFITYNVLVYIINEKEKRIKDALRMAGISDFTYWLSWILTYIPIPLTTSFLYLILFLALGTFPGVNDFLLCLLIFLAGVSAITAAFMLSPIFHKPKMAGIFSIVCVLFTTFLFIAPIIYEDTGQVVWVPLRLINTFALSTALLEAGGAVCKGGMYFEDVHPGGRGKETFYSLIMLLVDIFLYLLIAMYLDNIFPTEYGTRQSPCFCFCLCGRCSKEIPIENEEKERKEDEVVRRKSSISNSRFMERVSDEMSQRRKIVVTEVGKTYRSWYSSKSLEALKSISMEIYEGQITAILGKNGAGKSTLLGILSGLISPTSGRALILGLDTRNPSDMNKLRKKLGVCLQTDIYFTALTVREHFIFFAKLRGLTKAEIYEETDDLLRSFGLYDRADVRAKFLSGGQQRKLCVGMALAGNAQITFLDEPTAGLDPIARRELWSILQKKKENRIILLTTHFMDEADILADRKAIVHGGVVKCIGSSLFLKNRYGVGYHLTLATATPMKAVPESDEIIEKHIPKGLVKRKIVSHEVKYILPHSEVSKFAITLGEIEKLVQASPKYQSYGVSMTTMEDVFLKIVSDDISMERSGAGREVNLFSRADLVKSNVDILGALLLIRLKRMWRSPPTLIILLVLPLLFILLPFSKNIVEGRSGEEFILEEAPASYSNLEFFEDHSTRARSGGGVGSSSTSIDFHIVFKAVALPGIFVLPFMWLLGDIVRERELNIKELLRVSGLSSFTYYLSYLILIGGVELFFTLILIIFTWIFDLPMFGNGLATLIFLAIMTLFILTALLFTAAISTCFRNTDLAQIIFMAIFFIGTAFKTLVAIFIFTLLEVLSNAGEEEKEYGYMIVILNLVGGTLNVFYAPSALWWFLATAQPIEANQTLPNAPIHPSPPSYTIHSYSSWGIWQLFIVLPAQSILYLYILIRRENSGLPCARKKKVSAVKFLNESVLNDEDLNPDLAKERRRVDGYFSGEAGKSQEENCLAAVQGVTKIYRGEKVGKQGGAASFHSAVKDVHLMVNEGEIVGLLGHNGSGKTTLIKMISGDIGPTVGKVRLFGYDITSKVSPAFQYLGVCPQDDPLWEGVTLEEHLYFYATLRGLPREERDRVIQVILDGLQIESNKSKYSQNLSGGTRRKLTYAMSMLGKPKAVLMDEPSTGLDPQSKRFLWNTIMGSFKENRAAILSTHSMEEADILCSRIAILAKGEIICMGSPQNLKSTFGTGYTLELRIKMTDQMQGLRIPVGYAVPPTSHHLPPSPVPMSQPSSSTLTEGLMDSPLTSSAAPPMGIRGPSRGRAPPYPPPPDNAQRSSLKSKTKRPDPTNKYKEAGGLTPTKLDTVPEDFTFLHNYFPTASLSERFGDRAIFSIPKEAVSSIAEAFSMLEEMKFNELIEEYSFSQSSLEQVFLSFAKRNEEDYGGGEA